MISRIKALISGGEKSEPRGRDAVQMAAAALLVEAAMTDGTFDADERATVEHLLVWRFELTEDEARELTAEAEAEVAQSAQLYGFARVVNDGFSAEEKVDLLEMLWHVAYADGTLHDYEASLVRRISGLLHVSDRDSGAARKRALVSLGLE
ncbi:MAG: TerB family tellurite resistance protein [Rhodospirillales bacterium]|nr:TerB family tellurite resistance protein [Rhodospirillales bacterium]MCW8861234.1 TerB family tellurite resistance protein [Rhodospirillales bacterium]MCW8951090.1 TerB family tellurite resistance protein [Rhodospirillales bacterium]MCW8971303.1 TerB family tellurite resistance protein [Rhodospirillales bacterium]MCW9001518.1 TerB family tellurite resistance protein [Rhodospirillales bacterium]